MKTRKGCTGQSRAWREERGAKGDRERQSRARGRRLRRGFEVDSGALQYIFLRRPIEREFRQLPEKIYERPADGVSVCLPESPAPNIFTRTPTELSRFARATSSSATRRKHVRVMERPLPLISLYHYPSIRPARNIRNNVDRRPPRPGRERARVTFPLNFP